MLLHTAMARPALLAEAICLHLIGLSVPPLKVESIIRQQTELVYGNTVQVVKETGQTEKRLRPPIWQGAQPPI